MWRNRLLKLIRNHKYYVTWNPFWRILSNLSQTKWSKWCTDCKELIAGYCVKNNLKVSLPPMVSTFASYCNHCKEQRMYIVGDTSHTFCQKGSNVRTGLRKYKIDNSISDNDSCYMIEIHQSTINYNKGNCTENHFFLCKKEVS